jgi:hypothetical protein
MCVLCGRDFVAQVHWTDRHVEDKARASGPDRDPGEYYRDRRRDRSHRATLVNEVLCHYGLRLTDWSGSKYLVRDRKGRSELVQDLGALWPAAEKLAGRPLDPLDPALHTALREASDDATANGG